MTEISPQEIIWRLTFGDGAESYEFTRSHWMLSEARDVKKWTGLTPPQMWSAIMNDDPEALVALLCILRRRVGQEARFTEIDADYGAMKVEPINLPDDDEDVEPDPQSAA